VPDLNSERNARSTLLSAGLLPHISDWFMRVFDKRAGIGIAGAGKRRDFGWESRIHGICVINGVNTGIRLTNSSTEMSYPKRSFLAELS